MSLGAESFPAGVDGGKVIEFQPAPLVERDFAMNAASPAAMTVETLMTAKVHCLSPDMTIHEAIGIIINQRISGAPVVDKNRRVLTVVSEGDLLKLASKVGLDATVVSCFDRLVKSEQLFTLKKTDTFAHAYMKALAHPVHRFIVVDDRGHLEGIVSRSNILRVVYESKKTEFKAS